MQQYQDTGVYLADGCACAQALKDKKPKEAAAIFRETTNMYNRLFPFDDRHWFETVSKYGVDSSRWPNVGGEHEY